GSVERDGAGGGACGDVDLLAVGERDGDVGLGGGGEVSGVGDLAAFGDRGRGGEADGGGVDGVLDAGGGVGVVDFQALEIAAGGAGDVSEDLSLDVAHPI